MLTIQSLVVGQLQTNCYLISDPVTSEVLIVDPADASEYISDVLMRQGLRPIGILATHGHFDHILGAFGLQATYSIPFYIHADDRFLVSRMESSAKHFLKRKYVDPAPKISNELHGGEELAVGHESVRILHTPGHTPGSVVVHVPATSGVLVGDALFADGSVGRTDTSYGDKSVLEISIARIVNIPDVRTLYPGHGESVTVDRAKVMFGV